MQLENALTITKTNLKHNFLIHFIIAVVIALLTPLIFSINSLNARYSAQPIEMLLVFIGPVLLTPIFLPEQNDEIRDVICSKKTNYLFVCLIRIVYSILSMILIIGVFVVVMKYNECDVSWEHFVGGISSSMFLGAIGLLLAGFSRSVSSGYMAAMVYYAANVGLKDKLGSFYLFSMYSGDAFEKKYWLIGWSVMFIFITFYSTKKRFP